MALFAPGGSLLQVLNKTQFLAVHWIQAAMATLSIIGSSSIIGFVMFQNTVRSPEVRPLFFLSLSDLLLGVCWLTGALLYSRESVAEEDKACFNLQATGQIFYVASFLYTVNFTWHLYLDLKVKYSQHLHGQMPQTFSSSKHFGRITILFSSLTPILITVPVWVLGNHFECFHNLTAEHGCLLLHMEVNHSQDSQHLFSCQRLYSYISGVFLAFILLSFLAILILLIQARLLYKRFVHSTGFVDSQQWAVMNVIEQGVVLYPVVFCCCWGPAFILGVVNLAKVKNANVSTALYTLEALTASSQGFLNCIVYGWTQHMFRCVQRNACHDVDTQTPLLRSQKRSYAGTFPAPSQTGAQLSPAATSTVF